MFVEIVSSLKNHTHFKPKNKKHIKEKTPSCEIPKERNDTFRGYSKEVFFKVADYKRIKALFELQKKLGIEFRDINLLNQALLQNPKELGLIKENDSYEKLEFYGDAIFNMCIQQLIYENLKDTDDLKSINTAYSDIISNKELKKYTKKLGLDEYLIGNELLGKKTLADIFEALIGAIAVDGREHGVNNAYNFIQKLISNKTMQRITSPTVQKPVIAKKLINYLATAGADKRYIRIAQFKDSDDLYVIKVFYNEKKLAEIKGQNLEQNCEILTQRVKLLFERGYVKFIQTKSKNKREQNTFIALKPYEKNYLADKDDDIKAKIDNREYELVELDQTRKKVLSDFEKKIGYNFKNQYYLESLFDFIDSKAFSQQEEDKLNDFDKMAQFGNSILIACATKLILDKDLDCTVKNANLLKSNVFNNNNIEKRAQEIKNIAPFKNPEFKKHISAQRILKALLTAIYTDSKEDGFNNAYKLVEKIFYKDLKNHSKLIKVLNDCCVSNNINANRLTYSLETADDKTVFNIKFCNDTIIKVCCSENKADEKIKSVLDNLFKEGFIKIVEHKNEKEGYSNYDVVFLKDYEKITELK